MIISRVFDMLEGGPLLSLLESASLLASLEGGSCSPEGNAAQVGKPCCLPRVLGFLALADAAAMGGRGTEWHELLLTASDALRTGLVSEGHAEGQPGSLTTLIYSRWPLLEMIERLFQTPVVTLSVPDTIRRVLRREPEGNLMHMGIQSHSYQMRIFPHREIVSDMVRYSRVPFCGMRPFMSLVERVGAGASRVQCGGDVRCSLDFAEGGPHLGDCALWAVAVLEGAGVPSFAVGYEPLPDASSLFRESVLANKWDGQVVVVPKALAAKDGETVTLAYYPGHNGEGTTVRAGAGAHCGKHCDGFLKIPTVTLDYSWPALRPQALEVLKLSVNGEELSTIRGARMLLSKRQVCSVMMHVTKAQRGWQDGSSKTESGAASENKDTGQWFSSELWRLLSETG